MKEKQDFVRCELSALLRCVDKSIAGALYEECDNGEEYVNILYGESGGCGSYHTTTVCVTADSLSAMVKDVLREV